MSKLPEEERLLKLYDTLAKGDLKKELILPKCIVCIGLTRVGKSTVFNYLNGKEMIGKRVFGKVVYEPLSANSDGFAEVSASAISKTLIPNVLKINEDTCMIDTAGFRDKRNHIGVFSVNYMIKVIFEKGQLFSFILVISKDQIGTGGH
jgi:ribosome biogenesis GTPase A